MPTGTISRHGLNQYNGFYQFFCHATDTAIGDIFLPESPPQTPYKVYFHKKEQESNAVFVSHSEAYDDDRDDILSNIQQRIHKIQQCP